jgi:hemerythrin-like domain-containing protein
VAIHNLSEEEEHSVLARIAKIIYPDQEVPIPKLAKREKSKSASYSPPVKKLVAEHTLIKRVLALIPRQLERLDLSSAECREQILTIVDFIRSYADKYHHAKEEDILFKYFDETLDIIQVMYTDHTAARHHVKAIIAGVEHQDKAAVKEHLAAYQELLTGHIKREDEILYTWMDRNLSMTQVGELFSKFMQVDTNSPGVQEKYEKLVEKLEATLSSN